MSSGLPFIALIITGLAGMIWGLPASHRLEKPLDIVAAAVVLGGIVVFALGILLTFIPTFFR